MPYWPTLEGESKEVGRYIVTLLAEKDATDYKIRVMELTAPHRVRKVFSIPLCEHSHKHISVYSTCGPDSVPICHSVPLHFIPSPSTVWRKQYCVFKMWLFCYYQIQLDYGQKVRPLKVFSLRILKFCIDLFKCHIFCVSQKPSLGKAITNLFVMDWSLQIVLKGYDHFNMCSLYY